MTQTVRVEAGTGKWAYWKVPGESVIADRVCQPGAIHFAGQLGQAVEKTPCEAELHKDGFVVERSLSVWAREDE